MKKHLIMTESHYRKFCILIFIAIIPIQIAFAQSGTSLGLGQAYTALSRGSEAIFWNPANLAFHKDNSFGTSMSLYGIRMEIGNNSFNQALYEDYFTGENNVLTPEDIDRLLDCLPDDGLCVDALTDISLLTIAVKNFGISFSMKANVNTAIPKQMFEIPLKGLSQQTYIFNPRGDAEAIGYINLAYGQTIFKNRTLYIFNRPILDFSEIAVGASMSVLLGFGAFQTERAEIATIINDAGLAASGSYYGRGTMIENGKLAGTGAGLNLAFSAKTYDFYTISLVLRNVYHNMKWNNGTKEYVGVLDTGVPKFIFGDDQLSELESDEIFQNEEYDIPHFSTRAPFDFRIAVSRQIKRFVYATETGTNRGKYMFALGGGMNWSVFHLYTSYSYLSDHFFNAAIGLGGKYFFIDFGIGSRGGFTANTYKGLILASSLKFGL
ncbi:hypothetical protein JXQ31_01765 [candidate division KSB1 bacterium]|nr:hypothetical protein [candidate division KSB1 bacterium]